MPKPKTYIKILALLVMITFFANNFVISLGLGSAYYAVFIGVLAIILLTGKRPHISFYMLGFIILALFSIWVNDIPYFFRPYERLVAFVVLVGLIGPFLQSPQLNMFKSQLFKIVNLSIVIVVSLSFVVLVVSPSLASLGRGGFTGVFNHSMFMAPMAAISFLTCLYYATIANNSKKRLLFYGLSGISLIASLTAGSRAALISAILGALYFFYKINQQNLKQYFKIIFMMLTVVVLTFPLWKDYGERVVDKMAYAESEGSLIVTRSELWNRRVEEFNSSPLFGIGYSNDSSQSEEDLSIGEGQVEPGSSWLVVLSMTGIMGFLLFLFLQIKIFKIVNKKRGSSYLYYLGGVFVFFIIHLVAEGYALSAGSGLFFYFWLVLGVIIQNKPIKLKPH